MYSQIYYSDKNNYEKVKVESKLIKDLRKRRLGRNYLVVMKTRLKPYNADGFKTSMGPNEPLNMR